MTPEEYARIREVFLEAREQPRERRTEFLQRVCGEDRAVLSEVESLLANEDEAESFLGTPALGESFALGSPASIADQSEETREIASSTPETPGRTTARHVPQLIGPYRILEVLGEGGMGVVYRAEQENPRRTVALKVIKPGFESPEALRRFGHEGQILGRLQHPGIAQVYEAGTAETAQGRQPFFAMELVEGKSLIDYASDQRLDSRARLELFTKVCDAVHHAHQKGIIHRDLKPSNILIDVADQPKVLDFGVARPIEEDFGTSSMRTAAGQIVGTLAYMSPEQISGEVADIDIRTDIYSLGVICYELLTGRVPLDVSNQTLPQAARTIMEVEPPALRSVNRHLRGDVEAIVAKALDKDKSRRYQSASDFSADIRRYLSDQPISARPITTFYQLRKFTRRNKALVSGVAIAFVALGWGLIQVTLERNRAVRAERLAAERLEIAQTETEKLKAVNRFINDMLSSANPGKDGRNVLVADVLDRAATGLGEGLGDQPEIRVALLNSIGSAYVGLGMYAEAEPLLREAVELSRGLWGEDNQDTLMSMTNLSAALKELGKLSEAKSLLSHVLDHRRREFGNEDIVTHSAMNNLATILHRLGKPEEAEVLWREVLEHRRQAGDRHDATKLITMNNLGLLLKQLRRPAEAESLLREALELQREALGAHHPDTLATMGNLASALEDLGHVEEAEALLREVIELRRSTLGDHPSVYKAVNNLAMLLRESGRLEEAAVLARETMEGFRRLQGDESPQTLISLNNLASLYLAIGRVEEAEAYYLDLLATAERVLPEGHWMTCIYQSGYAQCLAAQERFEEAESRLLTSYEGLVKSLGAQHEQTHKCRLRLIELYEAWGKPEEAARWRDERAVSG